ncbi:MAG TPA: glycosyltransferase family 39 protein [bacterium]|jgi:uncharacterized membrane protein
MTTPVTLPHISAASAKTESRLVLMLTAIALLLRLPQLGASFYGDEYFSVLRDSTYLLTPTEDRFRPLFFSLLYLWRSIGFSGEVGLRLLPLLFGVAQIPVAFFIGRRLGGEKLARAFAVLMAASPMLIEFSQELRMYSMVALLALLQTLCYLRLLERPALARWLMFVLIGLSGVYTHLHYWIFLAGFALLFLMDRRAYPLWKGWGSLAATAVLYLPNIPNIQRFAQVRGGDYVVHLPSALPKLIAGFTLGFNYIEFGSEAAGRPVGFGDALRNLPVMLVAAVPALLIAWSLLRLHFKKPFPRTLIIGHALFTVPILLAFAACVVTKQYWLQPKYVIFSAPFALLLIAEGYLALTSTMLRRTTAVLGVAVCVVALAHFWNPRHYGRREDWRGAAQTLMERVGPEAPLLLLPGNYALLNYYSPEAAHRGEIVDVARVTQRPESLAEMYHGKQIYYLWNDIRRIESDPDDLVLRSLIQQFGAPRDVTQFNPRMKLYHWTLPSPKAETIAP